MELSVYISPERGRSPPPQRLVWKSLTVYSDGNIRYFEYENDKFEFLSEYKSGDPQRGLAFMPRRGINVSYEIDVTHTRTQITNYYSFMRTRL
jgi:hypothetical protein